MKLKRKVKIGDSTAYLDFEKYEYYPNITEKKGKPLNWKEIRILKCLCYAYAGNDVIIKNEDGIVENKEILKFVNECDYDMNIIALTKIISDLRPKITKDGMVNSEQYIESPKKGYFRLILSESPFSEEENFNYNSISALSALEFFQERLSTSHVIKAIDMSFFGGSEWLRNDGRLRLMEELRNQNIEECRIIINNSSKITDIMQKNMGHPDRPYTPIIQNIRNWYEYQKKYSPLFKIKVCPIPLLHCYYHIKTEETKNNIMRLHFYTYKNAYIRENYAQIFNPDSSYYHLYSDEFDYLWELSEDIEKYLSKIPIKI